MSSVDVLAGSSLWSVERSDCLDWLRSLPDDSIDLVVTSPPYVNARDYGIGFDLVGEDWVRWMVEVVKECARACKGLIACVCEGRTEGYRYDCTPLLLAADLHRAGLNLRKPAAFFRFGIPGSGGPDWWRNDWEPILCVTRPGKLPWSDAKAAGHPPKYGAGGPMSNRTPDGARAGTVGRGRRANGVKGRINEPSSQKPRNAMPAIANPGNMVQAHYDAEEVRQLIAAHVTRELGHGDLIRCLVGGGAMGSKLAHENEAPFPESLVMPFVTSFCPPGGVVADPFSGSGTTGAVALRLGRRFIGCDVRGSQVELASRRLGLETPGLPGLED